MQRHEGLSLLIVESQDADADAAVFRSAGIAGSDKLHFEREGKRPDGSTVKVGFSLAFADDAAAPEIHFASCQQHYPQNFWNPAFQKHANSATGIAGAVVVTERPDMHQDFFGQLCRRQGNQTRRRLHRPRRRAAKSTCWALPLSFIVLA